MSRDTFIDRWEAWDARPTIPESAKSFEDACERVARSLSLPTSEFRERLATLRRDGLSRSRALHRMFEA